MSELPGNFEKTKPDQADLVEPEEKPRNPEQKKAGSSSIQKPVRVGSTTKVLNETVSLPKKSATNTHRSKIEFAEGVVVSFIVTGVIFCLYILCLGAQSFEIIEGETFMDETMLNRYFMWFGIAVLAINLIAAIILAATHREFVKGLVAGYALILFVPLILGVFVSAFCLNPATYGR
jgi:hypothetical protein